MLSEQWKDVVGFEGFFMVSDLGRVKSLARVIMKRNQFGICPNPVKERILTASNNGRYPTVCLSVQGKSRAYAVHRLVLEAFVGLCPPGMCCRHFPDRDTANNRLSNLSWGTLEANAQDKFVHGTGKGWKESPETRARRSERMKAWWAQRRASSSFVVEALPC